MTQNPQPDHTNTAEAQAVAEQLAEGAPQLLRLTLQIWRRAAENLRTHMVEETNQYNLGFAEGGLQTFTRCADELEGIIGLGDPF